MENNNRIQLLSVAEAEELYSRPEFNVHEQRLYFTLTQSERDALTQFSNTKTRIFFILQLGYFKARQQFFNFSLDDVRHDVQFITDIYYRDLSSVLFTGCISRDYIRLQRQKLLSLFDYSVWSSDLIPEVQEHVSNLLRYYPKGHNAFRQLLVYFERRKITIPSYTTLQDIFSNAYSREDKHINTRVCL